MESEIKRKNKLFFDYRSEFSLLEIADLYKGFDADRHRTMSDWHFATGKNSFLDGFINDKVKAVVLKHNPNFCFENNLKAPLSKSIALEIFEVLGNADFFIEPEMPLKSNVSSMRMKEPLRKTDDNSTNKTTRIRQSQLHVLIWRVYQFLFNQQDKVTAIMVWNEIQENYKEHDTENIIQEVANGVISWRSYTYTEQEFSIRSISKTLSNLKRNPPF